MKKKLTFKRSALAVLIFYFSTILPFLNACRSESITNESETIPLLNKVSISNKKLSEIPEAVKLVDQIKSSANNILNKTIEGFEVDEDNVLVLDLQNEARLVSIIVQGPVLEASYSITNLNIVIHNGIESYFLTKYISSDGKPFYSMSDFIGTIQYLDLNGNILSSTYANKNETIMLYVGCIMMEINGCSCSDHWQIVGSYNICGGATGGGGGTNSGSNGGYVPGGAGGGGGGGSGGTPSQPSIPNIPTEDVVDQKRYKSFLTSLTPEEVDILIANQNLSDHIFYYQKDKNFSPASRNNSKWFMNFYGQTKDAEPFSIFDFGTKFIDENTDIVNPNNVFLRIYALDKFLKQNPDGLLDIPCNKIDDWKPIADHIIPQSVKDKLKNLNNKTHWYQDDLIIQNLDNAKGKSLNMDLFSVKISNLPNKPGTTQKFTAKEFFDYFRLHLNDFAEKFTPVVDTNLGVNDTALWNSANPLNALISIYIPVLVGHNNGTVICSGVASNTWVFTTITSPWDSEHPVSGNRFFSYYINPNDNVMYLYTRGLDRVNSRIFNDFSPDNNPAFNGADELWSNMQVKIKKFVKDNGGGENGATIMSPEIYRPDWVKVKDYMKGNKPLSSLGCK